MIPGHSVPFPKGLHHCPECREIRMKLPPHVCTADDCCTKEERREQYEQAQAEEAVLTPVTPVKKHVKKLKARWSKKENDILYDFEDHSANGHLLHTYLSGHGNKDAKGDAIKLWEELERRGYDKTTLRFTISKKEV